VGELLDSVVFVFVASIAGGFGCELFSSLVLTNYILKCAVEVIMTPVTYVAVVKLKKAESIDVYDVGISFNPFACGGSSPRCGGEGGHEAAV
jgi:uncharacterized PurR-regulated membrane protein YhhQ (DUF165 family)